jgi:SAM-dependent methyltransferase
MESEAVISVEHRHAQAAAFDNIGERYDQAFPHKEGQVAAGEWLIGQLPQRGRVLDAGCGTGLPTIRQLLDAGFGVTGIDISEAMLALARRNAPEADLRLLDLTVIGQELGRFDAVVAFFSLLMVPRAEITSALARLRDVLVEGGLLVLGMVEADLDDVPIDFLGMPIRVTGIDGGVTLVAVAGNNAPATMTTDWFTLAAKDSATPLPDPGPDGPGGPGGPGVLVPLRVRGAILGFAVWTPAGGPPPGPPVMG